MESDRKMIRNINGDRNKRKKKVEGKLKGRNGGKII